VGIFVSAFFMIASVRVEGKLFEVSGRGLYSLLECQRSVRGGCLPSISNSMNSDGWQEKWFVSVLQRESLCGTLGGEITVHCCSQGRTKKEGL